MFGLYILGFGGATRRDRINISKKSEHQPWTTKYGKGYKHFGDNVDA